MRKFALSFENHSLQNIMSSIIIIIIAHLLSTSILIHTILRIDKGQFREQRTFIFKREGGVFLDFINFHLSIRITSNSFFSTWIIPNDP